MTPFELAMIVLTTLLVVVAIIAAVIAAFQAGRKKYATA